MAHYDHETWKLVEKANKKNVSRETSGELYLKFVEKVVKPHCENLAKINQGENNNERKSKYLR